MKNLDKLAEVLGVTVVSEVSQVPRQLTKGRPSKKERKKMVSQEQAEVAYFVSEQEAKLAANMYAKDAHDNYFHSRRGLWTIPAGSEDEPGYLVYYNNNPYGSDKRRSQETSRITRRLKALGVSIVAKGQAGDKLEGSNERYTFSLILGCNPDMRQEVSRVIQEELQITQEELRNTHKGK